nr:response regulator [Pseudomonas fluorescens]
MVEDDVFLRSVMAEAISILGLVVTDCQSADQALIALESMEPFSLVITDVRMPGRLDGLDLAQAIWSRWPEVPVIIMSANTVLAPGFLPPNAKFLTKPVHLSSLHGAIAELLPEAD